MTAAAAGSGVDCIIPCYNNQATIVRAIASALAQGPACGRVIVVDDGSTDHSAEVVQQLDDPRITLIRQENGGPSAARNRGIGAGRAEFCAFLDADDCWHPGKLELQLAALAEAGDPRVVGHCVSFRQVGENRAPTVRRMPVPARFADTLFDLCMTTIGSTMLVRRTAFSQVGLFAPELRCFEDWEWQLRCLLHGLRFTTSPQVLVDKHESGRRRFGAVVESGGVGLRRLLPEIRTTFGAAAARRLAAAVQFELALSALLQRQWLRGAGRLGASLFHHPGRALLIARQAARRAIG